MRLPKVSGVELMARIGQLAKKPHVFVVTGYGEDEMRVNGHAVVRKTYRKPVDVTTIMDDVVSDLTAA